MQLTLQLYPGNAIHVRCTLPVCTGNFSFALLHSLSPSAFLNNGHPVIPVAKEACRPEFRPPMTKYSFSGLQPGQLTFDYEGPLCGFFLFLQPDLYHFSFYNGWYPMGFDADEAYDVTLLHDDSLTLVNGIYDAQAHCWRYQSSQQAFSDCNILLYNSNACTCIEIDGARLLFFDDRFKPLAPVFSGSYAAILRFYAQLYGYGSSTQRTIVFLPQENHCPGAYIRGNLIVFGKSYEIPDRLVHILAHELGHAYATGADTESWEDWLNETNAEWSALLYTLDHNPALFDMLIKEAQANYKRSSLALHPEGKQRPNDVHATGTLIYYDIYQRHGRPAVETLLKVFVQLPTKTTEHFIAALEQTAPVLAKELRCHL